MDYSDFDRRFWITTKIRQFVYKELAYWTWKLNKSQGFKFSFKFGPFSRETALDNQVALNGLTWRLSLRSQCCVWKALISPPLPRLRWRKLSIGPLSHPSKSSNLDYQKRPARRCARQRPLQPPFDIAARKKASGTRRASSSSSCVG